MDATKAAGVTLGLGFNRRYAPAFVEMKRRILAGEIGELLHIEGQHSGPSGYKLKHNWRATRAELPAGGMAPRGIHTLDSMINLGGLVSEVYAHSARRTLQAPIDMDDTTSMLLKFKSGITGYFATIFVTGELWRVLIFRITPRLSCWRTPARHPRSNRPGLPARCESELPGHRRARLSPYAAARYSAP